MSSYKKKSLQKDKNRTNKRKTTKDGVEKCPEMTSLTSEAAIHLKFSFFFFLIFFFNFYISEAYLTMTQSQIGERILCYANQGNWGGYACLENQ